MEFLTASLMINIIIPCNYLSVKKLLEYLNIIFSALSYQLHIVCLIDSILVEGIGQNDNIITYVHSLHLNKWLIKYFWSYM